MKYDLDGWNLSIRTSLLPKDTNQHGTIFGGVILSYIDLAGAIEAKRFCAQQVVTVAMKEVVFKQAVYVGDLVSFYTRIIGTGRTSITTDVMVVSFREDGDRSSVLLTDAQVTYVAIDKNRKPEPIRVASTEIDPPAFSAEYLRTKLQ